MKTYTATWSANGGSTFGHTVKCTNKNRLIRHVREILLGNQFIGNSAAGHFEVHTQDGEKVFGAYLLIRPNGTPIWRKDKNAVLSVW